MHYQNFHLVFNYHQYSSHKDIPTEMQQFLIYLSPNVLLEIRCQWQHFCFPEETKFSSVQNVYTLVV